MYFEEPRCCTDRHRIEVPLETDVAGVEDALHAPVAQFGEQPRNPNPSATETGGRHFL